MAGRLVLTLGGKTAGGGHAKRLLDSMVTGLLTALKEGSAAEAARFAKLAADAALALDPTLAAA